MANIREHADGTDYTEFQKLLIDGGDIWVVGNNRPNSALLDSYNPDVILCKYPPSLQMD